MPTRRLTVVSVAYPFAPVGPDSVGGAEQVLSAIDHALVAAGHRSIVLATAGSQTQGQLVSYAPVDQFDPSSLAAQRQRVADTLRNLLTQNQVDIVHMHGIDFSEYLPPPGPPVLATLHLPLAWYPDAALHPSREHTWLNCVSATQAAGADQRAPLLPTIPNGVPVQQLATAPGPRQAFALVLSRICPEKGIHLALQAAHAADLGLLIAGAVFPYPEHREYFDTKVNPLLDHRRRYLGPVGFARKRRLLAAATCLLIPSQAETSSLVAMEAASCGTPVIAFRAGALPEIVDHGRTGFIVDDVDSMAAAIRRIDQIDPEICSRTAAERFSATRMTDAYLATYRHLAA